MRFNEMVSSTYVPDYEKTPYWGYPENDSVEMIFDSKKWTVSNYYKEGYDIPFGQLVLVEDGVHWARPQHGDLAWNFMKQFRRNDDGKIEVLNQKQ